MSVLKVIVVISVVTLVVEALQPGLHQRTRTVRPILPILRSKRPYSMTKLWLTDDSVNVSNIASSPEIRERLEENDFQGAYQNLKRNPMLVISMADAQILLNNLRSMVPTTAGEDAEKQLTESCTLLYKRLERLKVLKGFGCSDGEYPDKTIGEITPQKLESITGISTSALTPKQRRNYWTLAGIGVCALQYALGESLGLDPLYTTIPATFAALAIDQLFYRGAVFESIYQKLFPEYKQKIIVHEAGHFLISYLLGLPVRGCVTNAWDARKYPEIKGQAGTIFYDPKLSDELAGQKVTRSSVDRMSIVLMAGIAAEALKFGKAEGGVVDEKALVGFLTSFSPPWNLVRIQGQARWSAMQAILLIREHQASFDALVEVLEQGKDVGDAILAIESNLPISLPSLQRTEDRKQKKKTMEMDLLMRYIQKVTWRVGGISPVEYDGNVIKGPNPHESKINGLIEMDVAQVGGAVVGMDGYIMGVKQITPTKNDGTMEIEGNIEDSDEAVRLFKEKIRLLERAAKAGQLDNVDGQSGGIWLNGLNARSSTPHDKSIVSSSSSTNNNNIVIPPPIEGYEERIEALRKANAEKGIIEPMEDTAETETSGSSDASDTTLVTNMDQNNVSTTSISTSSPSLNVDLGIPLVQSSSKSSPRELSGNDDILTAAGMDREDPMRMLSTKRGYQMKRLENIEAGVTKKLADHKDRIAELQQIVTKSTTTLTGVGRQ